MLNLQIGYYNLQIGYHNRDEFFFSKQLFIKYFLQIYLFKRFNNRASYKSIQVQSEPTRVRHESTRINTSKQDTDMTQHESKTGLDHEKEKNMTKRKEKTQFNSGVEDCIYEDLGFFLKFMTNKTMQHYFFIKVSLS